jgi:hypothetical protein
MALLIRGKTKCPLCGDTIEHDQEVAAFPAFLPSGHPLGTFSDAALHKTCFQQDARSEAVGQLYHRYREIWDSRPKDLKTVEEIEAWGREAFTNFP